MLKWCCFTLAALALGCGDDGPGSSTTEQTAALCDLYRVACARQAECGVYLYNRTDDAARCEEQLGCEVVVADLVAADIAVSITDANACRDTLAAASCGGLVTWDDTGTPNALVTTEPACQAVFEGQRAAGETCSWSEQCEGDLACTGQTCPGQCTPPVTACQVGDCADDEYCDGTCKPRGALGEGCGLAGDFENVCGDGLRCVFPEMSFDGTCQPQVARGADCGDRFGFFTCANGDVCRRTETSSTCQPPTAPGAACSSADECGYGSFCAFDAGNICKPWLSEGATCSLAFFECGPNADCDQDTLTCVATADDQPSGPPPTGTPRPFAGEGEDCAMANCGAGLACRPRDDVWRCEVAPAVGESCRPLDPADEFSVLLAGVIGIGGCAEGVCDVFDTWTCVVPAAPGEPCASPGFSVACASAVCKPDGTCAAYFEDCPLD